jgi:hypothetical protein
MTQQTKFLGIYAHCSMPDGYLDRHAIEIYAADRAYVLREAKKRGWWLSPENFEDIISAIYVSQGDKCGKKDAQGHYLPYRKEFATAEVCHLSYVARDAVRDFIKNIKKHNGALSLDYMREKGFDPGVPFHNSNKVGSDLLDALEELTEALSPSSFRSAIEYSHKSCRKVDGYLDVETSSATAWKKDCGFEDVEFKVKTRKKAAKNLIEIVGEDSIHAEYLKEHI